MMSATSDTMAAPAAQPMMNSDSLLRGDKFGTGQVGEDKAELDSSFRGRGAVTVNLDRGVGASNGAERKILEFDTKLGKIKNKNK